MKDIQPAIVHGLLVQLICLFVTACAIPKPVHFYREAEAQGLQRSLVSAGRFELVTYTRQSDRPGDTLHIYLGGDGVPWHHQIFISPDPGPYSALVLDLMKRDKIPSIYVGRPCYQGMARTPPCTDDYWTTARYSQEVVDSMAIAIQQIISKRPLNRLVLIGYSGGGTLALLLARKLPQTTAVVTVAGNLDIDAWTSWHLYMPLCDSINPAALPALDPNIIQIHVQGELDQNIPPVLSADYLRKQPYVTVLKYADADHTCCWARHWEGILETLRVAIQ